MHRYNHKTYGNRDCLQPYGCVLYKDPPPAPRDVNMTEIFTKSVASITLSWSAGSGADNYTITVTPESAPMQQRVLSASTESVQIEIPYNQQYLVNITAQNCAGRNSTVLPVLVGM